VINRLADPSSEHSLPDWYRRTGLPELTGNQLRGAGDDRFYRVGDLLLARQRDIERHLRERQRSLFNLERTVLLYDLTNTHFEGLCQRNPKAKRGANKQKRNDCAQIVVGMVFDQFGFEMAHKIFDGNLNCGCYVLRTDEQTLNEHQLWELYVSLSQAEDGFKGLKTDLGLRPNRHQTEERIDAHVFICVLAYHLLRNILWTLEQEGDNRNWETLKGVLRTHCYTTILLPTRSGQTHRIRKAGQPEECQKAIYRHLGIAWDCLPCTRSVIGTAPVPNEDHARRATL